MLLIPLGYGVVRYAKERALCLLRSRCWRRMMEEEEEKRRSRNFLPIGLSCRINMKRLDVSCAILALSENRTSKLLIHTHEFFCIPYVVLPFIN